MQINRDLGHSQLASYILSEMYVADLPLIERVQYNEGSDTDADEALSDDEPPMVDFSNPTCWPAFWRLPSFLLFGCN